MTETLISVIVPVYNSEKTLGKCLDALLSQKLREIEVVAVDNASIDGSAEILAEYAAKDERVRVLTLNPNRGPAGARNAGLKVATGDYVAFCDCDDWVLPESYTSLWKASRQGEADLVVGSYIEYFLQSGMKVRRKCSSRSFADYMQGGAVWNRLYRRAFLEENGLRFQAYRYGEDTLFIAEAYQKAKLVTDTRRAVYCYTKEAAGSLTNRYVLRGLQEYVAVERKIAEMDIPAGDAVVADYCGGKLAYLMHYWRKMPDLQEKEAGFRLFQKNMEVLSRKMSAEAVRAILDTDKEQFLTLSLGEYLAVCSALDERDAVLQQFAEGRIGARYIVRYSIAWLKFKWKKLRGKSSCQKSA